MKKVLCVWWVTDGSKSTFVSIEQVHCVRRNLSCQRKLRRTGQQWIINRVYWIKHMKRYLKHMTFFYFFVIAKGIFLCTKRFQIIRFLMKADCLCARSRENLKTVVGGPVQSAFIEVSNLSFSFLIKKSSNWPKNVFSNIAYYWKEFYPNSWVKKHGENATMLGLSFWQQDFSLYLTIRLRARDFCEQIVNETPPSWLSLVENEGE